LSLPPLAEPLRRHSASHFTSRARRELHAAGASTRDTFPRSSIVKRTNKLAARLTGASIRYQHPPNCSTNSDRQHTTRARSMARQPLGA